MKTIKAMEAEKAATSPARLMGFAELCEYVYEPLTKAKDLNLFEAERKAILESVEERCSSIPKRLTEGF
jgi:hypothetical protein